jgi:GntR family transcriptional regulator
MANWCSQDSGGGPGVSPRTRSGAEGSVPERRDVYEQLADELRHGIVSGQYKPGDRLPSTLDLMTRTGVANLTVRGAYRVLVEEGLVESVNKRGFYVRRPNAMTWQMTPGDKPRGAVALDQWAADAEAAGLRHRAEISIAIEDASVPVLGRPAGERLGLEPGSRVLVRRAIRFTGPAGDDTPMAPDSLADEYYPYDLVRDSPLASPGAVGPEEILAGLGCPLRGYDDEVRPRVATAEERRILSLAQVSVVLELARTGYTADRRPVLVSHQIRRGDGAIYHYEISYQSHRPAAGRPRSAKSK